MIGDYGVVLSSDALRFERNLPHSIDAVWDHIAGSGWLAGWLAPGKIEPFVGGEVTLQMTSLSGTSVTMHGKVTAYAPPTRLSYTWRETATVSHVTFDLSATSEGTMLALVHEAVPPGEMLGFGHGWHACLDALAVQLRGGTEHEVRAAWVGEAIDKDRYKSQLVQLELD